MDNIIAGARQLATPGAFISAVADQCSAVGTNNGKDHVVIGSTFRNVDLHCLSSARADQIGHATPVYDIVIYQGRGRACLKLDALCRLVLRTIRWLVLDFRIRRFGPLTEFRWSTACLMERPTGKTVGSESTINTGGIRLNTQLATRKCQSI